MSPALNSVVRTRPGSNGRALRSGLRRAVILLTMLTLSACQLKAPDAADPEAEAIAAEVITASGGVVAEEAVSVTPRQADAAEAAPGSAPEAALAPGPATEPAPQAVPEPYTGPSEDDLFRAQCRKKRGDPGGSPSGDLVCYLKTKDAGKHCSRSTDCQTLCLARSRTCAPITPLFGCYDVLSANGTPQKYCNDGKDQ